MIEAEDALCRIKREVARSVVGQEALVDGLLIGLLGDGHVLVEGVPGLAKTTAVRAVAAALGLHFGRIQFTPDLLPSDLTGNPVLLPGDGGYGIRRGPIFTSLLLADEINRAPAKVQSALLQAMEERAVTIGEQTLALPDPFMVMATQNPVELEGTYPLPEAQTDRFLLQIRVPYPSEDEEREIVVRDAVPPVEVQAVVKPEEIASLRETARSLHAAEEISAYAVAIARATRDTPALAEASLRHPPLAADARARADLLRSAPIALGASPRASICLMRAARAQALLAGRRYTTPHDVKSVAPDVLRHRIALTYEARADGLDSQAVIDAILGLVATP